MVAAHLFGVDLRVGDALSDFARRQPIVDPPADVARPGVGPMRPPGVGVGLFRKSRPEGVDKSGIQVVLKAFPLLVSEAVLASIRLWICQVNFFMRHVHIATIQHWLD